MEKTFNAAGAGAAAGGTAVGGAAAGGAAAGGTGSIAGGAGASSLHCTSLKTSIFKNLNLNKVCSKVGRMLKTIVIGAIIWWLIAQLFPELRTEVLPDFYQIVDKVLAGFNWLCSIILKILPF